MKYLLIFFVTLNCWGLTLEERAKALPDVRFLMTACGYKEPNDKAFMYEIIQTNDVAKIDCMESKIPEYNQEIARLHNEELELKLLKKKIKELDDSGISDANLKTVIQILKHKYK